MEKCLGKEDKGYLIPRGREPPYKIQGHELQVNEEPTTMNTVVRVLAYTGRNRSWSYNQSGTYKHMSM